MTRARPRQDSVDRHVALWQRELPWWTRSTSRSSHGSCADQAPGRAREVALADDEWPGVVQGAARAAPARAAVHRAAVRARRTARTEPRSPVCPPLAPRGRRTDHPYHRPRRPRRVHVELTAAGREAFDRHGQHEGRDEAALLDVLSHADSAGSPTSCAPSCSPSPMAVRECWSARPDQPSLTTTPTRPTLSHRRFGPRSQPRVEVRATSSGSRTTCSCAWSGLPASSRTSSAARRPSSWRGCRTEVRGTAAAPAK